MFGKLGVNPIEAAVHDLVPAVDLLEPPTEELNELLVLVVGHRPIPGLP